MNQSFGPFLRQSTQPELKDSEGKVEKPYKSPGQT